MNFKKFLNEEQINEQEIQIQTLLFLVENVDTLNESTEDQLLEGLNDKLGKLGLKLHKSKGVLDYIKSFTTGIGKLFLYMIKGDQEKAKALLQSIKKEDILDFLFKLDLGTLHLFTGPLHMIDAWTGWDLSVKMKDHVEKGEGIIAIVKQALQKVRDGIYNLFQTDKQKTDKLLSYINNIDNEII